MPTSRGDSTGWGISASEQHLSLIASNQFRDRRDLFDGPCLCIGTADGAALSVLDETRRPRRQIWGQVEANMHRRAGGEAHEGRSRRVLGIRMQATGCVAHWHRARETRHVVDDKGRGRKRTGGGRQGRQGAADTLPLLHGVCPPLVPVPLPSLPSASRRPDTPSHSRPPHALAPLPSPRDRL